METISNLNYDEWVTLNGTDDADIIDNNGAHARIDGRGGDDSINTTADNVTVTGGEGTNTITTYDYQSGVVFQVGQGNDLIDGFNASSTIQVVQGSLDTVIANNGSDLLLSVDDKVITLASAALLDWVNVIDSDGKLVTVNIQKTVNIGDAPKQITNIASGTTIVGGNGNDSIENKIIQKWNLTYYPDNVLILGNGGRDSIKNDQGQNVTINGGDGNDSIESHGDTVKIDGGDGNDFIDVTGNNISINAGEGNDFVHDINWYTGSWTNWTVDLGNGDDFLNIGNVSKSTIRGGAGKDSINSGTGSYVLVDLGEGDNTLSTENAHSTIIAGSGDDSINLGWEGENTTIDSGAGNDHIGVDTAKVSVNAGTGNDTIDNRVNSNNSTIDAGEGNDIIDNNSGKNVVILGGTGNDSIRNDGDDATIDAGDGADTIENGSAYSSISGGAGNDYIYTPSGDYSTITGGAGTNTINNYDGNVNYVTFQVGAGNDIIEGFNSTSSLQVISGTLDPSIRSNGSDLFVHVGQNVATLIGAAYYDEIPVLDENGNKVDVTIQKEISGTQYADKFTNLSTGATITGAGGHDSIENKATQNALILGGEGNDSLINTADYRSDSPGEQTSDNSTLEGGAGNDIIENNKGKFVYLSGGDGNDYLKNEEGHDSTIDAGAGKDNIDNNGSDRVYINGGEGDDTITNSGADVTISGGAGNDKITNYYDRENLVYVYSGGSDTIEGFNATSTLQIGDGTDTYRIRKGDSDVTITAGDGSILLRSAAELATLNIIGEEFEEPEWTLTDSIATFGTPTKTLVTVTGLKSVDGLSISGEVVTLSKAAVGSEAITISDGYTLALADDIVKPLTQAAHWNFDGDTATYKSEYTTAGYICDGKNASYVAAAGGDDLATVTGIRSTVGLAVDGGTITVSKAALNAKDITLDGDFALALGDDVDAPQTDAAAWTIKGTTATYAQSTTEGYTLSDDGKSIVHVSKSTSEPLATITGLKSKLKVADLDAGITIDDGTITLGKGVLGTTKVTVDGDYTLTLGDDVTTAQVEDAAWTVKGTTATFAQKQTKGYAVSEDGKFITYASKDTSIPLATVSGLKAKLTAADVEEGISIDGTTITLSASVLGTGKAKVSDGYEVALGDDVTAPEEDQEFWSVKGTTATLQRGTGEGYTCDGETVTFTAAKAGEKLATISGLKAKLTADDVAAGITVDDGTITLSESVLGTSTVKVTGDYALELDDDVTNLATVGEPEWSLKKTTATLTQEQSTGYVLNGQTITYVKKPTTATLATLTGVTSLEGIDVDGTTIKLSAASLGTSNVKLTKGDYTLEVDESLQEPTTGLGWNVSGTTATYKNTASAYYTANGKTITFHKAATVAGAEDVIKLQGLKKNLAVDVNGDISGITIDELEKTVTLSADVLNKTTVKITGDYALALDDDVQESTADEPELEIKKTTATLKQKTPAGYVLNDNTITYVKKETATTLATVTGLSKSATEDDITVNGETITMTATALGNKVGVNGAGYEFAVDGDYSGTITGSKAADIITVNGAGATVNAGKGDDQITSGGGNTFLYASGDGDDVIADFSTDDALKVTSGTAEVATDGADVVVTVTKGKTVGTITLTDAAGQTISILDKKGKATTYETAAADSDSYWFIDDDFETTPQLGDITATTYCMLGEMDITTDPTQLVQTTPIVTTSTKK